MKYIINTNMSKEQCIEYTKENLPKLGNYRKANFFGRVNNKGFKISINGSTEYFIRQNIARPVNVGRFEETENGVVTQMISLPFFAMCLMTFLFLLFTLLTIILDGIDESNMEIIKTEGITSLFFLLFTLIMIGIFKGYERKDMEEVTEIYSGK